MRNLKLVGLTFFCFSIIVCLGASGKYRSEARNPDRLGLEITTDSNEKILYVPVGLTTERNIVAYVPVRNGQYVSAVRVEPVMADGKVRFDVSAISGDYESNSSCADVKKLPARLVGTHFIGNGESLTLKDDLAVTPWRVKVKAVTLRPSMVIGGQNPLPQKVNAFQEPVYEAEPGPCGCARCGVKNPLWCCPARGQCMECSNCGTVCCPNG